MDSIARRCKQNSRAASRPQSRPFDAEGLARLRRTIRSVQECTNEEDQRVTSNASKERLESAQRDCMSACLNFISSRGEEPGDILKAARIFVGKISSTYTDEEIECVKTIREDAARCMDTYEHRRYSQDRRKHRGRGKANGKGKVQDVQVVINTGGGLKLFVVHTSRQVAKEVQVLLRQVILRAESAQHSDTRHARIDVNGGAASALAAPPQAGGETASGGINSGIDSNTVRHAREGSNQGSSGAAAAGPNGGGSATSAANEARDNPPNGNTMASWFVLGNKDIMRYLAKFVDQDQYLFIAPVSKAFRRAWGPRATVTRPVVADTSVTQLTYCLELGLPSTIRQATICNAAARFGRLDLLKLAQESACGWTPATCGQAARGGHLETLQWLRAEGCDWDEKTCQLAVLGGHSRVLKWVRSPTENWPTGTVDPNACPWGPQACAEAAYAGRHDTLKWLRTHGCPWDVRTCGSAAAGGFFDILQSAVAQGCPLDGESCYWAACRGDLLMLKWLRDNDCPWDLEDGGPCAGAAHGGHLEVLVWARRNGCPWNARTCAAAADGGHLEVLQWARENECEWDHDTFASATYRQHFGVMRWARANGSPWDSRACAMSAARGNLKNLQWLREEGCPWDSDTCTKAAAHGHLTLLIWALANGCIWDGELSDVADANGYGYIRGWVKNNVWRTTRKRPYRLISSDDTGRSVSNALNTHLVPFGWW